MGVGGGGSVEAVEGRARPNWACAVGVFVCVVTGSASSEREDVSIRCVID